MWVVWLFEWPFLSRALLFSGMRTVDCFRKGEISLGLPLLLFLAGGGEEAGGAFIIVILSLPSLVVVVKRRAAGGRGGNLNET